MRRVVNLEMNNRLIGIIARFNIIDEKLQYGIYARYFQYVAHEELIPILLTPENVEFCLPLCGSILLPGGNDINPKHYHEPCLNSNFDDTIDSFEFYIIDKALKYNIPILGICRGLQVLNVYFKGSLFQDVSNHMKTSHFVSNDDLTIYRQTHFMVNSYHHQAIKSLAPNFNAFLISFDGGIEGIVDKKKMILAVQYHPEMDDDYELLRYFISFFKKINRETAS